MADRLTIEHYVGECFIKCAQVVLSSRIYAPVAGPPRPADRRASRWVSKQAHRCPASNVAGPGAAGSSPTCLHWLGGGLRARGLNCQQTACLGFGQAEGTGGLQACTAWCQEAQIRSERLAVLRGHEPGFE